MPCKTPQPKNRAKQKTINQLHPGSRVSKKDKERQNLHPEVQREY